MLLDWDFTTRLAVSQGRRMLQTRREAKGEDEGVMATAPVHDMRKAESPHFPVHTEATSTLAQSQAADIKVGITSRHSNDEKLTWQEVMDTDSMYFSTTEGQLGLTPVVQKRSGEDTGATTRRPSNKGCATETQVRVLQMSVDEAVSRMAAVNSRLDSIEASFEAKLERQLAEQDRVMSVRLDQLERMTQRLIEKNDSQ